MTLNHKGNSNLLESMDMALVNIATNLFCYVRVGSGVKGSSLTRSKRCHFCILMFFD